MSAQPDRLIMSVENYLTLDRNSPNRRYEFIDGYAYLLAGGTANHSIISLNIATQLRNLLRGGSCRVYNSDMRVRLSETRYVYPDVSVSCDSRDRGTVDILQHPRFVVEVLSRSTMQYDRLGKSVYYRSCPTMEEYILVDTEQQSVEVYRRGTETLWTIQLLGPDEHVELKSLDISLPISAIYEDVVFP